MPLKIAFRYFFAFIIFLISLILIWTTSVKTAEVFTAHQVQPQSSQLKSTTAQEFRLVSNNQKPDQKVFITIPNQGYIVAVSCLHYMTSLCTDPNNQHQFRKINSIQIINYNAHQYIQNIDFTNTQTLQNETFHFTESEIAKFYAADIEKLKFQLIPLFFFSLFAMYVSIRILRNFKTFLNK